MVWPHGWSAKRVSCSVPTVSSNEVAAIHSTTRMINGTRVNPTTAKAPRAGRNRSTQANPPTTTVRAPHAVSNIATEPSRPADQGSTPAKTANPTRTAATPNSRTRRHGDTQVIVRCSAPRRMANPTSTAARAINQPAAPGRLMTKSFVVPRSTTTATASGTSASSSRNSHGAWGSIAGGSRTAGVRVRTALGRLSKPKSNAATAGGTNTIDHE